MIWGISIRAIKKIWCFLVIFLILLIPLQNYISYKTPINFYKKYYNNEVAIINISLNDTVLLCTDEELWKKALRMLITRMHKMYVINSYIELCSKLPYNSNTFVEDIRERNFKFTFAYFSGSKYKSIHIYS